MNEINPSEMGRQLRKPTGDNGKLVGENMNQSNGLFYDFVLSLLKIGDNFNILELGMGNGKFIPKFFKFNQTIHFTGVDFSEVMCSKAIAINKELIQNDQLTIICEDSCKLSFPENTFELVIGINVVYFWDDIDAQLQEIKRVLKGEGQLVIGYRPKSAMEKNLTFSKEEFNMYESADLQEALKRNGFYLIDEQSNILERKTLDGTIIRSTDCCMIAKKATADR